MKNETVQALQNTHYFISFKFCEQGGTRLADCKLSTVFFIYPPNITE